MKYSKQAQQDAREFLSKQLRPGATVYTVVERVSASGMSRSIRVVLMSPGADGEIATLHPNHAVAALLGLPRDRRGDGIRVSGAGMDMGFWLVYNLGRALWPDGFMCAGDRCPSNDHSNGDRDYSGLTRHTDGGYALRQRWL